MLLSVNKYIAYVSMVPIEYSYSTYTGSIFFLLVTLSCQTHVQSMKNE